MSPQDFVDKWRLVSTSERATAQSHFNDLCELLGEPKPHDVDPAGNWYAFEKGAAKTGGGDGWADVWKRGAFAWEYKGKHKDLEKALSQVKQYAAALENPPLLVTCDIERIVVTTNWTNTVSVRYELALDDLLIPAKRELLKQVFRGDAALRTGESRAALTQKVAREFAELARELESAGHDPLVTAHFVNRLVFCMFAEDAGLLRDQLFSELLGSAQAHPSEFQGLAQDLFRAMSKGGRFGPKIIDWFNGGLFEDDTALPLDRKQIDRVRKAAALDWSAIDPSILGTLFERGLDPAKRSQLGAHYTDPENIMRIVEPVVLRPLRREWEAAKAEIEAYKSAAKKRERFETFHKRLREVRVLDPACGSGNFLYMALRGLKDLEHRVLLEAEALGLGRRLPELGPECVHGIELSPYAAELARVTVWIGDLQWQLEHGFNVSRNPILKPLDTIENRDALLTGVGGLDHANGSEGSAPETGPQSAVTEAEWPDAEFIIGNPPFIGDKRMRQELGSEYTESLRHAYRGNVPGGADLVCYWFYRLGQVAGAKRAGLVATQMIRSGRNNQVVQGLLASGWRIFDAWQDEPWHDKGTLVRTSIVCLLAPSEPAESLMVDGKSAGVINPDLTTGVDVTQARPLTQNSGQTINGVSRAGQFNVPESTALAWLLDPNPSGRPNSDVLRPTWGADDLGGRWSREWVIDFGFDNTAETAAAYVGPFEFLEKEVKPKRASNAERIRREKWWQMGRPRPELRRMLEGHSRFLATGESMVGRFFCWLPVEVLPDHKLVVFDTEDDYVMGLLESRIHRIWAKALSSKQGIVNNDVYPASRVFGTFPFPIPTAAQRTAIADAARDLNTFRENWLNPVEWTQEETLIFPATVGGPWNRWIKGADALPIGQVAEAKYVRRISRKGVEKLVANRTLTKLYNEPPALLRNAHASLDSAVAAAYGLAPDASESEILHELLSRNLAV